MSMETMRRRKTSQLLVYSLSVFLFLLYPLCSSAEASLRQLYSRLDNAIANKARFQHEKEARIISLRQSYKASPSLEKRYKVMRQLASEYDTYNNDTAIVFLKHCVTIAEQMGDQGETDLCRSLLAYQYVKSGFYAESMMTLDRVSNHDHDKAMLVEYYKSRGFLFDQLATYAKNDKDKKYFQTEADSANKALLAILPRNTPFFYMTICVMQHDSGHLQEALNTCNEWAKVVKGGTHDYAVMMYYRYWILNELLPHSQEAERSLLLSAICDVETATYDETSIFNLCQILKDRGEVSRAQTYMKYAYAAAVAFGGKMRDSITHDMEEVNSKYVSQLNEKQKMLNRSLVLIIILFLLTFSLLVYSLSQHKKLRVQNNKIREMVVRLRDQNKRLIEMDGHNQEINQKLSEANLIKDEYIGTFFGICSSYINWTDKMLKTVNKMLRNKQYEDLYRLTKSSEPKERALNELYSKFDKIFLSIFPTFVSDFNALLLPEAQVIVKKRNTLNTQLRIFALIRLGIDDSSKICELLNLAPSTVYNYRTKFRNEAKNGRALFEDDVKKIGQRLREQE